MKNFLTSTLATIVGLVLFSILSFFLIIGIFSMIAASEDKVEVKENSVLSIDFSRPIFERENEDPLAEITALAGEKGIGLIEIRKALNHAKNNEKIKGVYLKLPVVLAGYASSEEIRNAIMDFKTSGKFVIAYSEYYSEGAYYLATAADKIFLNPSYGMVELNGLSYNSVYLKKTFEKLEVEPIVFRVGTYKSAVEPFLREDMSEAAREQAEAYMNNINNFMIKNMAEARGLSVERVAEISDKMLARNAEDAKRLQLVDELYYKDEVNDYLRSELGIEDDDDIEFISHSKYIKSIEKSDISRNKIAVIVATGEIVNGDGETNQIGGHKFAKEIRKARQSDRVKAIVLRINSPGGSALASDLMWREVIQAAEEKPIIASMSDVSASGGYYMAMGCDTIVAQPTTITGSIGIFGLMFNIEKMMENKLGVTFDNVKTGEFSDLGNVTRPMTDAEKQIIQNMIEEGYETFTSKAAEGRNMPLDELKEVASGRVWSGIEAKEIGLIDVFGGLQDAIQLAADAAGVGDDYRVAYCPYQKTFIEELMSSMGDEIEAKMMKAQLGEFYPLYQKYQEIQNYSGIQARSWVEVNQH
ncbi:MAG TPA: signal peptide peptidase SppA [Cytophagales bacterium]|nr:signal peptide peptidase SppA [Cytophagales bacterium]